MTILIPTVLVGVLGVVFGFMLAWFAQKFAVETNPLQGKIEAALPGANCGVCGYPGCSGLAAQIVKGEAPVSSCPVGGPAVWGIIAQLTGKNEEKLIARRAALICQGDKNTVQQLGDYRGIRDCRAASVLGVSFRGCVYGCLGLGTCEKVCPFDALYMNEETDLPEIDWEKCTGCGKCVKVCPRGVLVLTSDMEQVQVACHSPAAGKDVRLICKKGCIKCQLCVKTCPVGAISSVDGMIKIDQEKCTRCDLCIEKCPTSSIVYLGKKAVSVA